VDPTPENLVAPGIEPGNSGSVGRNSDHWPTDVVVDGGGKARNKETTSKSLTYEREYHYNASVKDVMGWCRLDSSGSEQG
jgi:hypothetical protein